MLGKPSIFIRTGAIKTALTLRSAWHVLHRLPVKTPKLSLRRTTVFTAAIQVDWRSVISSNLLV
jgi:hypothetical protein